VHGHRSGCTLKETFGADGQPGSYTDIDSCDAVFLYGHNMAETQTVLWSRILDRLAGPDRPKLVCIDPRDTDVARHSDVHLAVRPGTNLALMYALIHEVLAHHWDNPGYTRDHTLGLEALRETVEPWTAEAAAVVCDVSAADIKEAARIFGTSGRVLSTVLQGFYQSSQATAASCQVNNLHLLRGMLGRPGCGILQMNGQPTAQNHRECGADGDLPGFRNWENPQHVQELAGLWNVDPAVIPHWAPPTHAMQIFRYAEQGPIGLLWISATNPAVSMPDLPRIREVLAGPELFLVVQDLYLTETTQYADVVLPAAGWGEKTGTFTNASRTVHISEKAVDPPGEARSDLEIFLDYARRMGFTTLDGTPLLPWSGPEDAFEAWKACSRGRPCDYTGMSYGRLRSGSGIPWPCNEGNPDGRTRLYEDGVFASDPDYCEDYGHDLLTGATIGEQAFRAQAPGGRRCPQNRGLPSAARGAGRGIPVPLHHRPHGLSLPHPHEDGTVPATVGRRAQTVGGTRSRGRGPARHHRGRPRPRNVTARPDRSPGPGKRDPSRHRLRSVPLRILGHRRQPGPAPDRRERIDPDRMGSCVQATDVQERGGQGSEDRGRSRPRASTHHDGLQARRARRRLRPGNNGRGSGRGSD